MNDIFILLGIEHWKPVVATLLLPPVPFLLLLLVGARLMLPRRGLGWFIVLLSITGLWFSHCTITARALSQFVLHPPAALSPERVAEIKAQVQAKKPVAIVVLGGGVRAYSPEYGVSNLQYRSLERLRFGLWLGRETGLPVAFSGGVGWGQPDAASEASIAAQIATGVPPPAAPSRNAPNAKAISIACRRWSAESPATESLIRANRPVSTVML